MASAGLVSTGAPRERAYEVTTPHAEPLPVSTPAHRRGPLVAELLWEWDSGLASGALQPGLL